MTELTWAVWPPAPGPITGRFGETGPDYPAPHRGLDIGCPTGTPVRAPVAGRATSFYNDGSFGTALCIDAIGTPYYVLLAHLSESRVSVGDTIAAGDIIGTSGATGRVSGPHLHVQVCTESNFPTDIAMSRDPLSFLATAPPTTDLATLHRQLDALRAALAAAGDALRAAAGH